MSRHCPGCAKKIEQGHVEGGWEFARCRECVLAEKRWPRWRPGLSAAPESGTDCKRCGALFSEPTDALKCRCDEVSE